MLRTVRQRISRCVFVGCLLMVVSSPLWASPVTLPSGKVIDLAPEQLELLKQTPGVYYFNHQPDKVINESIRHWSVIALPQDLGGGFLIAMPQNLAQGLDLVNARELRGNEAKAATSRLTSSASAADKRPAAMTTGSYPYNWQWSLDIGYRIDDFDWNIAGDKSGANPNILSELTWSDLEILQVEFGVTKNLPNRLVFKGSLALGKIFDGENQDSDYFGDNRTAEFSRSNNSADDGATTDGSIGLGYSLAILPDNFMLIPYIGFSFHVQNLNITDGVQTIATPPFTPDIGPFPGLNSSYDADWYGPWGGLELNFRIYKNDGVSLAHKFHLNIEYHWVDYDAEADWNLRTDLAHPISFEHKADGSGIVFSAGHNYFFSPQWSFNVNFKYQKWETDPGTDRVFFADGSEAVTRLNEVNWESSAFMVGVTRRF